MFGPHKTKIRGENATGKTTQADGWNWLINAKDSSGRSTGEIRPIHQAGRNKGEPIRGLVMMVEAFLFIQDADDPDMNGDWILRKEESEKSREVENYGVGKVEYAYTKKCWINGDHVLENKFQAWLANIAQPDILRALTDIHFFLADEEKGGIHHTKRRKMVRAIAGDIGKPPEFDDIETAIKGRTLEGYKKELTEAKAEYEVEKIDKESRIKEKVRDIQAYVASESEPELIGKREMCMDTIETIETERKRVLAEQVQRQKDYLALNKLNGQKLIREADLMADTSATEALRREAERLRAKGAELRTYVAKLAADVRELQASNSAANELSQKMLIRTSIQKEYSSIKNMPELDTCFHCQQKLPTDKLEENRKRKNSTLATIRKRGNSVQAAIKSLQLEVNEQEGRVKDAIDAQRKALADQLTYETEMMNQRLAEIAEEIRECPRTKPEDDEDWNEIWDKIKEAEAKVGPPVAGVLEELEARKSGAEAMRDKYSDALRAADTVAKDKLRVEELDEMVQELAQKIVTNNGKLARIRAYVQAESQLITDRVDGRFKDVEFRLFKLRKNGEIQECCDAMVRGVSYAELSGGETVRAQVDAATVLGTYYNIRAPLFIDDCEHMTRTIDVPTQTIELYAAEGVTELEVELC